MKLGALFIALMLVLSGCGAPISERAAPGTAPAAQQVRPKVRYDPTPQPTVEAMLRLAGVGPADVVYDLGSGDGRIPIAAATLYGARGVGIDIDPQRIAESNANARAAGVTDRVVFRQGDLFEADIREATVVTLFLTPATNKRLRPKLLRELRPGTRIVSFVHDMGDWRPERKIPAYDHYSIYLWRIPPMTASAGS